MTITFTVISNWNGESEINKKLSDVNAAYRLFKCFETSLWSIKCKELVQSPNNPDIDNRPAFFLSGLYFSGIFTLNNDKDH